MSGQREWRPVDVAWILFWQGQPGGLVKLLLLAALDRANHPLRPWIKSCVIGRLCEWTSYQQARL